MKIDKEFSEKIEHKLKVLGAEILHKVEYPGPSKRLFDYIVKKDESRTFIKVIDNVHTNSSYFKELKKFSGFLNLNALIIADKMNDENIIDGVLHIRDRVGIIQVKTVYDIAKGEKVYVYEFKGMFYVKIDGRKLRELRLKKGYRLSELAKSVGASVKALQMYEEGLIDMSVEKAYRFMEIFDKEFEEVLKEVDIFKDRISDSVQYRRSLYVKDDELKQRLIRIFREQGAEAEMFNHLPSDVIVNKGGTKIFISLINDKVDFDHAIMKAKENRMLSQSLDGVSVNIVSDDVPISVVKEVENYGITLKYGQVSKHGIDVNVRADLFDSSYNR